MSVREMIKNTAKTWGNVHRQGPLPNVFLFATPRGGSTWMMEIIASQPGMKYYDEPFNLRRDNVAKTGLFPDFASLMPEQTDAAKIVDYLNALRAGRYGFLNPPPYRPGHRFFTDRIVFKVHELEHLIGHIARECHGQIVYLLRHPVPVTLSRKVFPRLELFLESPYYADLIGDSWRLAEIRRLGRDPSHLRRGIVSWCYENVVPLRHRDFDGLLITYEEMTLNPQRSCDLLLQTLNTSDRPAMLKAFGRASSNIAMSSAETHAMMNDHDARRRREYLVAKWQARISAQEAADVGMIMELFGLDVYDGVDPLPRAGYLHFSDTVCNALPEPGPASGGTAS